MIQNYEYKTTQRYDHTMLKELDPVMPEGDGWELINGSITGNLHVWTWRKLLTKPMEERFHLVLHKVVELGKEEGVVLETTAEEDIELEKLITNMPCYNFFVIDKLEIAGKNRTNDSFMDGANYGPNAYPGLLGITIKKGKSIRIEGKYTGISPAPFTKGQQYVICLTLCGRTRERE